MDEMHCSKAVLVSRQGLRVQLCLTHRVVEVEMGAISIRLDEASFQHLSEGLSDAVLHLAAMHQGQLGFERWLQQIKNG